MLNDAEVRGLLDLETLAEVADTTRRMRLLPPDVARSLREWGAREGASRPAEAAQAEFLARVYDELSVNAAWEQDEGITAAQNELLAAVWAEGEWPLVLGALKRSRSLIDDDFMRVALSRHTERARLGVADEASGLAAVLAIGVLGDASARGWAHVAYARSQEAARPDRSIRHFALGVARMRETGDTQLVEMALAAQRSFGQRQGLGALGDLGDEPDLELTYAMIPLAEERANSLRDQGKPAAAVELFTRMVPLCEEFGDHERLLRILNVRALAYEDLGDLARAEEDYRAAIESCRRVGDAARLFEIETNLAASMLKRGRVSAGISLFARIAESSSGNEVRLAAAKNNLAHAYMRQDRWEDAAREYADVELMTARPEQSRSRMIALAGLISALDKAGDDAEAAAATDRLFRLFEETQDLDVLFSYLNAPTVDLAGESRALALEVLQELVAQGDVMLASSMAIQLVRDLRRTDEHENALAIADFVLSAFDSVRSDIAILIPLEVAAAEIERRLGNTRAAEDRLRAAVTAVEHRIARATRLRDADWIMDSARALYLGLAAIALERGEPAPLRTTFELADACLPVTLTSEEPPEGEPIARDWVSTQEVLDALGSADTRLTLIEFALIDDRLCAFVLDGEHAEPRVRAFESTREQLAAAAREFSLLVNGDPVAFPDEPFSMQRLLDAPLVAFEGVMADLGGVYELVGTATEAVCFVPTREIEGLPLHALKIPTGERLIETVGVFYSPSAAGFARGLEREPARAPTTVVCAAVASLEDPEPDLIEGDAALFARFNGQVETRSGPSATPAWVRQAMESANVAHITCHGYVDEQDPFGSALLLGDGESRPTQHVDDISPLARGAFELTVRQLRDRDLVCDLVTLRACSTARRGAESSGEEMSTLSRALQLGGCRTVVTALWDVDQRSSLALLETFYRYALGEEPLPAWQALARAMRRLIHSQTDWSHVYFWGPFVVSGEWRPYRSG
ncbi:CHAT domain-containing protein [Microbacterium sp. NPDC058062]|uniref:CHAT domain-containing protein n=1 Tax=Microbacterium sp. NPDC058062 TaxID=3346320 RepID=UPI0036DA5534